MKFTELETIMHSLGVNSLAEIARRLETTPQAVSNWKARNQIPYHIIAKVNVKNNIAQTLPIKTNILEGSLSASDILVTLAEQIKVILLIPFLLVFIAFTYVQFIKVPKYQSSATVLLPESQMSSIGGIAGLASQFGVNIPSGNQVDLSSPSLYPELISSRTFAERILDKEFYLKKFGGELPLINILNENDKVIENKSEELIGKAVAILNSEVLSFQKNPKSNFSIIRVVTTEPHFSKELAELVLRELEALSRSYKSQAVSEKTSFIENRIFSVNEDLEFSEIRLKDFKDNNRQISSPALQLQEERLERNVEVQKEIYLTLKQQLELAKIEEVQEASIVQILDKPQLPLGPYNKNLKLTVVISLLIGIFIGVFVGVLRAYNKNADIDERKKLRRVKFLFKKKLKDLINDRRVSGIISGSLLFGLPFYLGYRSKSPVFFGLYSTKLMILNTVYILFLIIMIILFLRSSKSEN